MYDETEIIIIIWEDSFGALGEWIDLSDFKPEPVYCISTGVKVFEDEKIISLAPTYATETSHTSKQANGIMTIPINSIIKRTSFSLELALKQKQKPS